MIVDSSGYACAIYALSSKGNQNGACITPAIYAPRRYEGQKNPCSVWRSHCVTSQLLQRYPLRKDSKLMRLTQLLVIYLFFLTSEGYFLQIQ